MSDDEKQGAAALFETSKEEYINYLKVPRDKIMEMIERKFNVTIEEFFLNFRGAKCRIKNV